MVLGRVDVAVREGLARRHKYEKIRRLRDSVGERMEEVRLADARRAVDRNRVVRLAGVLRDGERGRVGDSRARPDDEGLEGERGVERASACSLSVGSGAVRPVGSGAVRPVGSGAVRHRSRSATWRNRRLVPQLDADIRARSVHPISDVLNRRAELRLEALSPERVVGDQKEGIRLDEATRDSTKPSLVVMRAERIPQLSFERVC